MNKFTVIERDKCVLIEGPLPINWMTVITGYLPKHAIASPDLARMLGANFAFGLQQDVDALIESIKPELERVAAINRPEGLSDAAARWLASGERGISSNSIFTYLTGVNALGDWTQGYPLDPSDFRRCRLLLDQVPELAEQFPRMANASKTWARLVRDWDAICKAMDKELPDWRTPPKRSSCPEAYKLIKLSLGE